MPLLRQARDVAAITLIDDEMLPMVEGMQEELRKRGMLCDASEA